MPRRREASKEFASNTLGWRCQKLLLVLVAYVAVPANILAQEAMQPALYPVVRQRKTGFIDRQGNVVITPQFDAILETEWQEITFSEGLQPVAQERKWGYVDRRGVTRIPFQFTLAGAFSEGLAAVEVTSLRAGMFVSKYGYIDHTGRFVIPAEFDYAGSFSEGLASIVRNGEMGYIDKKGSVIIKPQFASWSAEISPFSEGLAGVQQKVQGSSPEGGGLWGFIDKTGNWVLPPRYKRISPFHDGLAAVHEQGETVEKYIDHSGKTAAGPFAMAWAFSDGLAQVVLPDGRKGFINRAGTPQFIFKEVRRVESFIDGMAKATILTAPDQTNQVGYIDRSGKFTIPAVYSAGSSFHNGLAFVISCNQSGYIDMSGRAVWGINSRPSITHPQPAPLPGTLTAKVIGTITESPAPLDLKETPVSGACGPFGKRIWYLQVSSVDRATPLLSISLVEGGTFLTDERMGDLKASIEMSGRFGNAASSFARPLQSGARTIGYASVGGLGPGGSIYVASVFSPDRQYELVVTVGQGHGIRQLKDPLAWISKVTLETLAALFPQGR